MKPSPEGLPVEVYCFTSSIFWVEYENSRSAIFEYIYAIVGQFGLRMYQHPGGNDFWRLSQQHASSAKSVEQQAD